MGGGGVSTSLHLLSVSLDVLENHWHLFSYFHYPL